jgi:anti-sigma regulatory factor (Ser/Thr protein kinase)
MSVQQTFAHGAASLVPLLGFVETGGAALGLPRELILKLQLIAEELFTNAVHHGGAPAEPVSLELSREHGQVQLCFEDGGIEYNPFAHIDPAVQLRPVAERPVGRLGVVLIEGLAQRVDYQRCSGRNRIRLWLTCTADAAPADR